MLQRLDDVEQAADVHVEPERAQQPAEDEQVPEQPADMRDVVIARRRAGEQAGERLAADGVDVLLRLEHHAERALDSAGSSVSRSSATSAATQSSVSDTPGTLYSSCARSSWTSAVTCSARRADA